MVDLTNVHPDAYETVSNRCAAVPYRRRAGCPLVAELVTFGETMLRLSPPDGERLETATELDFRTAGAESNVAITAARLGTDATWLSKLPESALGRRVAGDVERHGVQPAITWSDDGRQGTYYIEPGTTPRGTNVIYDRADAAVTTATPDELAVEQLEAAEMFYTSGITPALSDQLLETVVELLETATAAGTTTAFDLNYRSKLWSPEAAKSCYERLFSHVDVLVAAARDARTVLDHDGSPAEIAERLHREFSFELVVLTLGADGALAVDGEGHHRQDAYEADTVDPIGTGDAFVGGFLARLLADDPVPEALTYAAATAALKRTIVGDIAVVTPDEVRAVIDDEHESVSR